VKVRRARAEDAQTAGAILDEASAYLAILGFTEWPVPFPQDELALGIERGELYVVKLGAETAGTITLLWDDPTFWGERPPDAAYVHKLAIRRHFAGQGVGAAVVDWADAQAAAAGRRFLRLDCQRDNPGIRAYYERLGFVHRGDVDHPRVAAALYERPVRT
jgi:GNAT superfamily N-acetyltransferase